VHFDLHQDNLAFVPSNHLLSLFSLPPTHKAIAPNMAAAPGMAAAPIAIYNAAAGAAAPGAPNQLFIQNPLPAANGPLLVLDTAANLNAANWTLVARAGANAPAAIGSPGIYSTGQLNCMSILVAFFNPPVGPGVQWTQCYLAHVSHVNHSQIPIIIGQLANPLNVGQVYVIIGGQVGMLGNMQTIAGQFANAIPPPLQILIYSATTAGRFACGMRRDGEFGQVN
jgi:hypothetical protein